MEFNPQLPSLSQFLHHQRIKASLDGKHDHLAKYYKDSLPNFIIIGAAKSATTSLAHLLERHDQIHFSSAKEPKFFGRNYGRGWTWYSSFFEAGRDLPLRGEASTMYSSGSPSFRYTPELIKHHLGLIKLVYLIRHPMKRIVSHWRHYKGRHPDCPSFDNLLRSTDLRKRIIETSLYYKQLQRYLNIFPETCIHCMTFEELTATPKITLRRLFRFLGVRPKFRKILKKGKIPNHNVAGAKGRTMIDTPRWPPILKQQVLEIVRPDAERMLQHMGRPLDTWDWGH